MRLNNQATLSRPGSVAGVALHSGVETRVTLKPAAAGAGVVFRRIDLARKPGPRRPAAETIIDVGPDRVVCSRLGVKLENAAGASAMTVEHLLAALSLCGVDNAFIDLDGPELPILDGSARPFIDLIESCGIEPLDEPREAVAISETLREQDGDRFVQIEPWPERAFDLRIEFADAAIGAQHIAFVLPHGGAFPGAARPAIYNRLAHARTFCTLRDVDAMRAAGFSLGGSLDNAIVVDRDRLLNPAGLRDPEEFVLHKALDLIGDLSLVGAPVIGKVTASKPGHDLNTRLARRILASVAAGVSSRGPLPVLVPADRLTA